jgi:hypothetical protein
MPAGHYIEAQRASETQPDSANARAKDHPRSKLSLTQAAVNMPLMMRTHQAIQMKPYISLGGSLPTVGPRSHRALKERATEPHALVD